MAAVVHDGGAGTTTTPARFGTPQVVAPRLTSQTSTHRRHPRNSTFGNA
ncbi:hypothetical protein GTZ85_48355 [Streptomyces sp. SID5474]|nr:hypothetical protein [Streptomyces sp. SID5474]